MLNRDSEGIQTSGKNAAEFVQKLLKCIINVSLATVDPSTCC